MTLLPAAGSGPDDQVGLAVAVEVLHGNADAAAAVRVADEEVGHRRLRAGQEVLAGEREDPRPAALPAADDDVREAVPVQISGCEEDAVAERRLEGEEVAEEFRPAGRGEFRSVKDGHARSAACPGRDQKVGLAVTVDVAERRSGPAAEVRIVDPEEIGNLPEAISIKYADAAAARLRPA